MEHSPSGYIYNTTTPTDQGHRGRGDERLEEPEEQEVCCETVTPTNVRETESMKSHQHGCQNMTWTRKISIDTLISVFTEEASALHKGLQTTEKYLTTEEIDFAGAH